MDAFNTAINSLLRWYYMAFSMIPMSALLAMMAFYAALGMLWVFSKTSNPKRIRAVKRLVQAHLLEMRLFRDEPAVVWKAQGALLRSNARYIGLMLQPALWVALPLTLLLVHMDAFHGRAPLPLHQDAIVTMAMREPFDEKAAAPVMTAPPGILAVTPPVRVSHERQISWRIRPMASVSGSLRFVVNGETVDKQIEAGPVSRFIPGLRPSSLSDSILHPDEPRIPSSNVDWIDVRYPSADMEIFGIRMHWVLWFTIISMLFALLLRKRFGVVL
jgi:hypothetical protein